MRYANRSTLLSTMAVAILLVACSSTGLSYPER
jgi:hypothetical protein